jgi:CubicO group peptidase (beta-lactamase class C family)
VPTEEFASDHNRLITWNHLLRQTSDWEGTLWGKPDWADRPPRDQTLAQYRDRRRTAPGTFHKYNDVRVNLLAFAALNVWRRPLPQVLREYVMDPIGASNTWRWHGYDNSWVNIDGTMMQSVSGGGHWGGGMWISARDQARFGLLTLRRGQWRGQQILSETWVRMALTPTAVEPGYGFMNWYLNTRRELLPSAPETTFCHVGAGANMICAVPDRDLLVVVRWIETAAVDGLLQRVLAAITDGAARQP